MKKEIKLNTITWILLVLLICLSTIFSENGFENAYLLITGLAVIKFTAVMFEFVDVKHAHIAWKIVSVLFVVVYSLGIIILF
ncbi:MAG: hypothetical protein HRT73_07040 [Flavobacteriales bacterium]|nr:hypothetical protein [Flavobacteriales bacterium]